MKNISFSKTIPQILDRSKTETRRLGWHDLKEGETLRAVDRVMGFKKGERPRELAIIVVNNVYQETLKYMSREDVRNEGFPGWSVEEFVSFFCKSMKCTPDTKVTIIKFDYVDQEES